MFKLTRELEAEAQRRRDEEEEEVKEEEEEEEEEAGPHYALTYAHHVACRTSASRVRFMYSSRPF